MFTTAFARISSDPKREITRHKQLQVAHFFWTTNETVSNLEHLTCSSELVFKRSTNWKSSHSNADQIKRSIDAPECSRGSETKSTTTGDKDGSEGLIVSRNNARATPRCTV